MDKKSKSSRRLAFYEPPACVAKTSSEIINEARAAMLLQSGAAGLGPGVGGGGGATAAIQPVNTKRPYTPRDKQRTLFGRSNVSGPRPPSSFSLRYLQFQDGIDSVDAAAAMQAKRTTHLLPMSLSSQANPSEAVKEISAVHSVLSLSDLEDASFAGLGSRLPSISRMIDAQDIRRKRRHQFRTSASLGNLAEELESVDGVVKYNSTDMPPSRNAYSSPKEHTDRSHDVLVGIAKPGSTTPRKVMRHDNSDATFLREADSRTSENKDENITPLTQNKYRAKTSSDSVGRSSSDSRNTETFADEKKDFSSTSRLPPHSTLLEIEGNLFGPNITSIPVSCSSVVEVDGGVFGETLLATSNGILQEKSTSDRQGAMYDNHVNEAKLAHASKSTLLEECPGATSSMQATISKLNDLAINGGADGVVMHYLDELYAAVNTVVTNRKDAISAKLRAQVLKCIYRFVERAEDALLLRIARIIFCLPVTGSNLAGACKLVFKVARSDKNDRLFLEGNILDLFVDALGTASPLEDAEACVYGYGALKFLTMNNQLLSHVLNLGTLDLMVLHLKLVNTAREEGGRLPEQTSHAVFQLTGALRNIAGEEAMFPQLVSHGAVTQLCQSMNLFSADLDLVTNIARTFSIISTNDDCCSAIVKYKHSTQLFAKLLSKYPGCQDIVVRLGYALGNLLAKSDEIRLQLLEEDGAMDTLLDLLELYLQKDLKLATQDPSKKPSHQAEIGCFESGSDGSIEDVIVKIVRIVANMSMNKEVGERLTCHPIIEEPDLSSQKRLQDCNIQTHLNSKDNSVGERSVISLLAILRRKSVAESAELVLSALSTLNNLTYYPSCTERSVFHAHLMDLSQGLCALLTNNMEECLVETTKVLGNLTRSKPARDFVLETGGLDQLLRFLQTDNHELLRTTTGVLVNLMADVDKREAFRHSQGITRLIGLLMYHGDSDWQLASLICQVLWNFCIDMTHVTWLGMDHTTQLLEILADFLDEEHIFGSRENNSQEDTEAILSSYSLGTDLMYQQWEDFAAIATNLLEKIENFMETSHHESNLTSKQLNISTVSGTAEPKILSPWEEISTAKKVL